MLVDDFFQASSAELHARTIYSVRDAITEEHEHIPGIRLDQNFIVSHIFHQPERNAGGFHSIHFSSFAVDGTWLPGIRDMHGTRFMVPNAVEQADELCFNPAFIQ